ncbi:uncharacterized protein [Clytia hemisphaerica]
MLTPSNYGPMSTHRSDSVNLLKVVLNNDSTLKYTGDISKNTAVIFHSLIEPVERQILMKTTSRIKPEWIEEVSSERWQKSVNFKFENGEIKSLLENRSRENIGDSILSKMKREAVDGKTKEISKLKHIKIESNIAIKISSHSSEVKVYGSKKEVEQAWWKIEEMFAKCYREVYSSDQVRNYPNREGADKICKIKTCLVITEEPELPRPAITQNFDEWYSQRLVLNNKEHKIQDTQIAKMLSTLKEDLQDDLKTSYEEPKILCISISLVKIKFKSTDLSREYEKLLNVNTSSEQYSPIKRIQEFFEGDTKAFLDQELELRVKNTNLYPSVRELTESYQDIELVVGQKNDLFRLKKDKENRKGGNFQNKLDEVIAKLKEQKVFGSEMIELTGGEFLERGERAFVYWKIKEMIKEEDLQQKENVIVHHRKYPLMMFEVFGEYEKRMKVANQIHRKIESLKIRRKSKVFNEHIPIHSSRSMKLIHQKIQSLREQNPDVQIALRLDEQTENKHLPSIHFICEGDNKRRNIEAEIKTLLQDGLQQKQFDSDTHQCCLCYQHVVLPKTANQKFKEREEVKQAQSQNEPMYGEKNLSRDPDGRIREKSVRIQHQAGNEGRRLILCGCIVCRECFEWYINECLDIQKEKKLHDDIKCPGCKGVVMIKDLGMLAFSAKEKICEKILTNYLQRLVMDGKEKIDACAVCRAIYVFDIDDKGIYRCRNSKCRLLSCSVCKKQVMGNNKLDFEQHRICWE